MIVVCPFYNEHVGLERTAGLISLIAVPTGFRRVQTPLILYISCLFLEPPLSNGLHSRESRKGVPRIILLSPITKHGSEAYYLYTKYDNMYSNITGNIWRVFF
jgi:hypothetical protein